MPEITYDELVRSVPIWVYATNRDIVAEMPRIISDAEDELVLKIDHDLFQTVLTGFTIGPPAVPDPGEDYSVFDLTDHDPRVFEVRAMRLAYKGEHDWVPLERRPLEFLSMLYSRNKPGRPRYYAEFGDTLRLRVFPYPAQEYQLEVTANVHPLRLGPTPEAQTNRLTRDFPRAVEKACLRQAALFMKNWEDATAYGNEMTSALTEANAQMARRRRDETGTRPEETVNAVGR